MNQNSKNKDRLSEKPLSPVDFAFAIEKLEARNRVAEKIRHYVEMIAMGVETYLDKEFVAYVQPFSKNPEYLEWLTGEGLQLALQELQSFYSSPDYPHFKAMKEAVDARLKELQVLKKQQSGCNN